MEGRVDTVGELIDEQVRMGVVGRNQYVIVKANTRSKADEHIMRTHDLFIPRSFRDQPQTALPERQSSATQ